MQLTLNGTPREVALGTTLGDLLAALGLSGSAVVVERNGRIVPREDFPAVEVAPEDRLEIVRFVGGG